MRRASFCFPPSPLRRREDEIESRSMILVALTFPTPGRASSTCETFILPTTSSRVLSRSSPKLVLPARRSSFNPARRFLASAAFASASRRWSGVSEGGRGKQVLLPGDLSGTLRFEIIGGDSVGQAVFPAQSLFSVLRRRDPGSSTGRPAAQRGQSSRAHETASTEERA